MAAANGCHATGATTGCRAMAASAGCCAIVAARCRAMVATDGCYATTAGDYAPMAGVGVKPPLGKIQLGNQNVPLGLSWVLMVLLNVAEKRPIFNSKWTMAWHHGMQSKSDMHTVAPSSKRPRKTRRVVEVKRNSQSRIGGHSSCTKC